ncbi:hypothetical protein L3X38_010597 [Prunus dulcis]|uniref:Uncharacterized protein n=1 Tax=Prunus dulcis TaxID=3755 RepID=A0AAD4WIA5_PRUDU|nr:hypothetical protein L3X38_010597 [Prunus dulcis]
MRTKVHNWDDEIDGESKEEEIEGIVGGGVNDNLGKDDSGRMTLMLMPLNVDLLNKDSIELIKWLGKVKSFLEK